MPSVFLLCDCHCDRELCLRLTSNLPLCLPPDPTVTRLFLVRHGSTEANERRPFVLQGCEIDGPLTVTGQRQAAQLAEFLAGVEFSAIYASPMFRALQTAARCAESRGLAVTPTDSLKECRVGRWQGLSWDQIRERDPVECERFLADPAREPHPGGESYQDLLARVAPAIDGILAAHPGKNVLVVAHNMVNRTYLAHLLGIDLRFARRIRQSNCCINIIHCGSEFTDVVTVNSVWHLTDT